MSARRGNRWLVISCGSALAALALMAWQVFDPTVWPVMVAMSLGQVLGTVSFAAFGYVVLADYRARRRTEQPPLHVPVESNASEQGGSTSGELRNANSETPEV
jgi:putative Ca2+/H+ antiporter (TMEM165/GDT1 family)